jgi:hypothetical protein
MFKDAILAVVLAVLAVALGFALAATLVPSTAQATVGLDKCSWAKGH